MLVLLICPLKFAPCQGLDVEERCPSIVSEAAESYLGACRPIPIRNLAVQSLRKGTVGPSQRNLRCL